ACPAKGAAPARQEFGKAIGANAATLAPGVMGVLRRGRSDLPDEPNAPARGGRQEERPPAPPRPRGLDLPGPGGRGPGGHPGSAGGNQVLGPGTPAPKLSSGRRALGEACAQASLTTPRSPSSSTGVM